jgi:hypothetical protein
MTAQYLKRRSFLIGATLLGAGVAIPVGAKLSRSELGDVAIPVGAKLSRSELGDVAFDGDFHQVYATSLFRQDASKENLIFIQLPAKRGEPLPRMPSVGEHFFDLSASTGTPIVQVYQYREAEREPFPICYPGTEPVKIWTGVVGRLTVVVQAAKSTAEARSEPRSESTLARLAAPRPGALSWLISMRIEDLRVSRDPERLPIRMRDVEIPPLLMSPGPFGG